MKAVVYKGDGRLSVEEVSKPEPKSDELLIRVRYAGLCGSDLFVCSGNHPRITPPTVIGHEFCGEVEEVGEDVRDEYEVGERVVVKPTFSCLSCEACQQGHFHVCRNLGLYGIDADGGFAEYVTVSSDNVVRVGGDVDFEELALIEPLAVAVHAVRRSQFRVGDRVVILGGGPIGLLVASVLRLAGASLILISEINDFRLKKAEEMGFRVINPQQTDLGDMTRRLTNDAGADVVFEAAGVPATSSQLVGLTRIRGEIVVVGVFEEPGTLDFQNLCFKEQTVTGIRVYTIDDIRRAVELLEENKLDLRPFITHRLGLDEVEKGMDLLRSGGEAIKILIAP